MKTDRSVEAQIRASVTYNMIIEGVLAETGYHGFERATAADLEAEEVAEAPVA